MTYAQLTYRERLRNLQESLSAGQNKIYHTGFCGQIRRNTLANANAVRGWRIYEAFARLRIAQAQNLFRGQDA